MSSWPWLRPRGDRFGALTAVLSVALVAPIAIGLTSAVSSGSIALSEWIPSSTVAVDQPGRSTVVALDGSVFATFFRQDRVNVRLDQVAQVLKAAVLATEDAHFYQHGAVDPIGIARALVADIAAGKPKEGASTLTQQLVKVSLLASADNAKAAHKAVETTVSRKVRELGNVIAVENHFSKDEIFTRYLNLVYFGAGAYGIEVAAQRYFSKPAAGLTLPEAALLAGLIKSPVSSDPIAHPAAALARRSVVLARMVDAHDIDAATSRTADVAPLGLHLTQPHPGCAGAAHPFFCIYVLSEIGTLASLGRNPQERLSRLLAGGLTVHTTLDPKVQASAEAAVHKYLPDTDKLAAAIVMTEPGTGAVRAISINRRFGDGHGQTQVDYALDKDQGGSGGFQAGSTFKPFVLAAAAEKGIEPDTEFRAPAEVTVDGFKNCQTGKQYHPYTISNYKNEGFGRIDMAKATALSVNAYFVQLAQRVGTCRPPAIAESMGVDRASGDPLARVPSFVLGSNEVSPLRMAEAYATFAADGKHCPSNAITSITAADGTELKVPAPKCKQVIPKEVAATVTRLLEGVINGEDPKRTGKAMSLGLRPVAGKTGTTDSAVAVWFDGYSRELAAAVWAGYPDRSKPLRDIKVRGRTYSTLYGGALPGPIWRDAMAAALKGRPVHKLQRALPNCDRPRHGESDPRCPKRGH